MLTKAGFYTFIYGERVGDAPAPPFLKFRSSNAVIIATIATAVFTDLFLYSLVVPVLPFALTVRAGVEEKDVQKWTSVFLSVYGAAMAVGSLIFGWFADRSSSRRMPLLLGLLALGGSTVMFIVGSSVGVLVTGRFFQGLSAAAVWTVGLALLSDTIAKEDIGQAMGYVAAATSLGSLLGPLLGGVVYAHAGYYVVFVMGFIVLGVDIVLRLSMIEKSVARQWGNPDDASPDIDSAANQDDEAEIVSTTDIVSESEKAATTPKWVQRLPPLITLLRSPRLLAAMFGTLAASIFLASFDSTLPLYVKDIFHWNSNGAGLIFLSLVIPSLLGPVFGFFSDKYGTRAPITIGFLAAVPCWILLRFVTYDSIRQKVLLCALLALLGLFLAMVFPAILAEIDHTVALEEKRRPGGFGKRGAAAQGFGLFNFADSGGSLVGPLWSGFVVRNYGWGTMGWSLGILSAVAAVLAFFWAGGRNMLKGKERGGSLEEVV